MRKATLPFDDWLCGDSNNRPADDSRPTVTRKFQRLVNRGLLRIEEKGQYKAKVTQYSMLGSGPWRIRVEMTQQPAVVNWSRIGHYALDSGSHTDEDNYFH